MDHPILLQSLQRIRQQLPATGWCGVQEDVLLRLVHSSGDLSIARALRCSGQACEQAVAALADGVAILTDTAMAAAAVAPMAQRTFGNPVVNGLLFAPHHVSSGETRTAHGLAAALEQHPGSVVLIGSAPTALMRLLDLCRQGMTPPVLVVGMPVGFVGVLEAKAALARTALPQVRLEGTRGGAGLAAAVVNALLRRAWLDRTTATATPLTPPAPLTPSATPPGTTGPVDNHAPVDHHE